ncbi:MAG: SOSS complex subunit B family protein, partial [Candidatus Micrarchaeota archaeon]
AETVDFYGRVIQLSELREFQREKRIGKVLNVLVTDIQNVSYPMVLWDYYADWGSRNLRIGDAVKAENAVVKKSMAGFELHLNWSSHLIINPKDHGLKKEEEMLRESLPTMRILDLKAGGKGIVKATLSKINKAEMEGSELFVEADIHDEINVPVKFQGRQALEILQLRNLPEMPIELVVKLKEDYIKGKRVSLVVSKQKDKSGTVAKHFCDHMLNFI